MWKCGKVRRGPRLHLDGGKFLIGSPANIYRAPTRCQAMWEDKDPCPYGLVRILITYKQGTRFEVVICVMKKNQDNVLGRSDCGWWWSRRAAWRR